MKSYKFITAIIVILIIGIVGVFGLIMYSIFLNDDFMLSNANTQVQNEGNKNIEINVISNSEANVTTNQNIALENQIITEPVINISNQEKEENLQGLSITSKYYYNQLNETAKTIYDGLADNKEKLILGNYIINYDTKFNTLLNTPNGSEELNTAFQSAWDAFSYDNVDLFYIDATKMTLLNECTTLAGIKTYRISIGPGNNENYFQNSFKSSQDVQTAISYLENIKQQMTNQIKEDTIYNRIKKVHDWLIYFVNYENTEVSKDEHTIYGTLKNGKAVCEGYAKTLKYLLDDVNVPCVLVSGTGINSNGDTESHEWNYIQLNEKWYAVDVTWDDPVIIGGGNQTEEMKQRYFLKGSVEFFNDHKEDGKISDNSMVFKFPTLNVEDYAD